MIKVKDEKDKFEVTLDVSQYKPEELKVSTVNNVLSIEGKHEEEVRFTKINVANPVFKLFNWFTNQLISRTFEWMYILYIGL